MRKLISREQINFAPGQDTFGLTVYKETWDCNGETKIWWKYGLPDCVLVIPFTAQRKVVVIDEFQPIANSLLSFIGGAVEENEDALRAGKRELFEETGYQTDSLVVLSTIAENTGRSNRKVSYVLATCCERFVEPEQGISVSELEPEEFWGRFYSGLTRNPEEVHDGPYTLQGAVLAFAHMGIPIL